MITHKYRGSQQFSRVEYSTQIYRFDTRGAKEYLKVLAAELSTQPHLEITWLVAKYYDSFDNSSSSNGNGKSDSSSFVTSATVTIAVVT